MRTTLILLLGVLTSFCSAQTYYAEDFENGQPAGWYSDNGWGFGTTSTLSSQYFTIPESGSFYAINDDALGAGGNGNGSLTSTLINLSDAPADGGISLSFDAYFINGDYQGADERAIIYGSRDGENFDQLAEIQNGVSDIGDDIWQTIQLNISDYAGDLFFVRFEYQDGNGWNFGLAIDNIEVNNVEEARNMALNSAFLPFGFRYVDSRERVNMFLEIQNNGYESVNSFDIILKATESITDTISLANLDFPLGGIASVDLNSAIDVSEARQYNMEVSIENINGGEDELPDDNVQTVEVVSVEDPPSRILVAEEATGTWCVWCPRGAVFMDQMEADYPDEFIGIAVHNSDPMAISNYDSGMTGSPGFSGFPSAWFDRILLTDPSSLPAYYDQIFRISPISLDIEQDYNISNRELTVNAIIQHHSTFERAFSLAMVMTENNVTGSSSGYAQANNYAGGAAGPMGGYEDLPNPVPAADMVYNHVARALLGGWSGVQGAISNSMSLGQGDNYTFEYEIPTSHDIFESHIIILVIDDETGEVVHGFKDHVRPISGSIDHDNDGFTSNIDCDDYDADINMDAEEIPNNDVDEDCDGVLGVIDEDMDGFNSDEDCDDTNAAINPDAEEIPNNDIDEDCDGFIIIIDGDQDGYNSDEDCDDTNAEINPGNDEVPYNGIDDDCDAATPDDDLDGDGFNAEEDCDDSDASINPGAEEIINNNIDENCDGIIFIDIDSDGYSAEEDCDDVNPNVNPGAEEIPNNTIDEDCDGVVLVIDEDMDGFNSDEDCDDSNAGVNPQMNEIPYNGLDDDCDPLTLDDDLDGDGFNQIEDCDDTDASINPSSTEIPNNAIDEDCDGIVVYLDNDMDGFNSDEDCDDNDPNINPDATEIPNNDVDEDCDGIAQGIDADMDGFLSDIDCDDNNADINPEATEIPNNDIDEDCDGIAQQIDEDGDGFNSDEDCDDANAAINPGQTEIPNNDVDEDCDGVALVIDNDMDGFNSDEDCDDNNPSVNPDSAEIPNNDIDEDCDGTALVIDEDMDGYNSDEDCDDNNAQINPGQEEVPNNAIDEDCDGTALVIDEDMDGFNSDEDCDDTDASINPDATEIPNNAIDEDCDGDALVIDEDMDGFNSDEDCDDNNALINPGNSEIAYNGLDDDCDPLTPDDDLDGDGYDLEEDCDDDNAMINPDAEDIPNNGIDENCDGMDATSNTIDITELTFNIYPNPASTQVIIETATEMHGQSLLVLNYQGKVVRQTIIDSKLTSMRVDQLNAGLYFILLKNTEGKIERFEKLVIE